MAKNSTEQTTNYEALLLKLDGLRGQSGAAVHERVRIACIVFHDDDFRANLNLDDFKAEQFLDRRFADLDVMGDCDGIFNSLRRMYEAFPSLEDWSDGDLSGLRQKCDDLRKEREAETEDEPKPTRRRATLKALEEAEQRAAEAEAEAKHLRERVAELERDNAVLEGRLSELEKVMNRSYVTTP